MLLVTPTRLFNLLGAAALALFAGCFTEPEESPSTTGPSCDPGSFGCECFEGGCAPDLVCTPSNVCIAEDCTPGTAVCECDAMGLCGAGLECQDGICRQTGTTSVGTDTDTSTTNDPTTTTTSSTTTMPDDTGTTAADSSTTEAVDTTDGTADTTGMPVNCAEEPACDDCFDCTANNECSEQQQACEALGGCLVIAECMKDCAVDGLCFDDCCDTPGPEVAAAMALQACREDTCIVDACESYSEYTCSSK